MSPTQILDAHIHLWPATATSSSNHGWMVPGHHLSKQHSIQDYAAISDGSVWGFVYVETDRYLPSATPNSNDDDTLRDWAKEPLSEIRFLRRIVEGTPEHGDGFLSMQEALMKGVVLYAPLHLPPSQLERYLELARHAAGETLWKRVVGFRYLLQGKKSGEVEKLLNNEDWIVNILRLREGRGGKGWTFDIGIDTHRDGVEMLRHVVDFIEQIRLRETDEKGHVIFVLNHLCKPPISASPSSTYLKAFEQLSVDRHVFMKLSGALNEFAHSPDPNTTPSSPASFLLTSVPYIDHAFSCFPDRVMFGSDWPVCNVGGPKGEPGNWSFWADIVEEYLNTANRTAEERDSVWWKAGIEAYGLDM